MVEIFNNVNSGGTKLSKGDLALAKLCGQWADARSEIKRILNRLKKAGYSFDMEWLLRCTTIYITGKAYYSELVGVTTDMFRAGLKATEKLIDVILNQIGSRLGLDHDRVLGSRYSIPTMVGYLRKEQSNHLSNSDWNKLLYWYVHTIMWGRYAGSTESVLAQDMNAIESGQGIDGLIRLLRQNRGDLNVRPDDFNGWSTGARFYPLLYMLTRVCHARDWGSGLELRSALLGKNASLEVHHIFPKAVHYAQKYDKATVNALANYTFLTRATNEYISNREPSNYIPEFKHKQPGTVESHWMPEDTALLTLNCYKDFLEQRRILLTHATNAFLDTLLNDNTSQVVIDDFANRELVNSGDGALATNNHVERFHHTSGNILAPQHRECLWTA